jgi:hypothetical protein
MMQENLVEKKKEIIPEGKKVNSSLSKSGKLGQQLFLFHRFP